MYMCIYIYIIYLYIYIYIQQFGKVRCAGQPPVPGQLRVIQPQRAAMMAAGEPGPGRGGAGRTGGDRPRRGRTAVWHTGLAELLATLDALECGRS